jgi:hypothetical protein
VTVCYLTPYENSRRDPEAAREIYKQAAGMFLDYPVEYLFPSWVEFEHQFGDVEDVEYAESETRRKTRGIQYRQHKALDFLSFFTISFGGILSLHRLVVGL